MAAATQIAEKYVDMSHGRTRYFEAGTGYPTILLHGVGFTGGGDGWFLNIGPLSSKLRVIAPDFVGWGLGDRLDLEYAFAELSDFVREFQDALGIEKSNIVGHSMGGWVASVFAYESPDRVNKLVLVAAGGAATRTLASMTQFKPPAREDIKKQLAARIHAPGVDLDKMADEQATRVNIPGSVEAYQRIMNRMNNPVIRQRYHTLRRLAHVRMPTLVIWGRQDETNALELGEQIHATILGSKMVVIENCGHFIPTDRPEEFNQALLEFL
jgi:pimeloyl-ACP methyl ester carboxylesterase